MNATATQKSGDDSVVMMVRSATPATSLGSAIAHSVRENKNVSVRAVGQGAVSQTCKALAIAKGFTASEGHRLTFDVSFFTFQDADGEEKNGMNFKVIDT
ncbi:stage V sporulation protein S [Streptomyces sp. NBC_00470]|uniref:stage V sporulation protein S n=1 Tax=Streptomyces sp. NBC_00470 TaxID=2975753 RepID=UPI0030DE6197